MPVDAIVIELEKFPLTATAPADVEESVVEAMFNFTDADAELDEVMTPVIVTECPAVELKKDSARTAVVVSSIVATAGADANEIDCVKIVADDGATERTPRPNAATATSAMRLNVVFVDICFLSIVDLRNFRRSAWN